MDRISKIKAIVVTLVLVCIIVASVFIVLFFQKSAPAKTALIKPQAVQSQQIIAGKPVQWVAIVSAKDLTNTQKFIQLPKQAENILIKPITEKEKQTALNNIGAMSDITPSLRQQLAKAGGSPAFAKASAGNSVFNAALLPQIQGLFTASFNNVKDFFNFNLATSKTSKFYNLSNQKSKTNQSDFIEITYQTPAPAINQKPVSKGREVTISAPNGVEIASSPSAPRNDGGGGAGNVGSSSSLRGGSEATNEAISYTNVLAYASIPEIWRTDQKDKIKIEWNGNTDTKFTAFDLNNNGKIDYVEWTVPHLSTETYTIIYITKALKLDENLNVLDDITDAVKLKDNTWATVNNGQYIRATFQQVLHNNKDITIVARPSQALSNKKSAETAEVLRSSTQYGASGLSTTLSIADNNPVSRPEENSEPLGGGGKGNRTPGSMVDKPEAAPSYPHRNSIIQQLIPVANAAISNNGIASSPEAPRNDGISVEVYPVYIDADGNQTEGPKLQTVSDGTNPDFSNIDHKGKYRILLQNLQKPTDVFDLKVVGSLSSSLRGGSQADAAIPNNEIASSPEAPRNDGGVSGVDFDWVVDPTTKTISDSGGTRNWNDTASWVEAAVPVNGDDVVATATSGNLAVNVATANLNSFDLNGYTGTLSGSSVINVRPANGTTVNVRFVATGGCTWSGSLFVNTVASGDTGTTINLYNGGRTFGVMSIGAQVSSTGLTVNQQDDFIGTNGDASFQLLSGTWTTNNHNLQIAGAFYAINAGVRTFNAGSSIITINGGGGGGYGYFYYTGSNLTFNAGTSTINLLNTTTSNATFYGGGLTFYNINRTGTAVGTDGIQFNGNLTIATGGTLTLNGNGGNGTTTNYRLLVSTTTIGTASTITFTDAISVGTNLVTQYADFRDIAFNASANLASITGGSGDAGGNSNITFTTADTETWGGSAGSWATKANWTGGTVSRVPLPQDTVVLAGTNTVTVNQPRLGKDISFTGATPLTLSNAVTSYGSVNLTNMGAFAGNYLWAFESQARTGALTLTSNGKTFYGATVATPSATVLLADAFTVGTRTLTLSSGTLDSYTNNVTITAATFTGTAGATLKLGTGILYSAAGTNASAVVLYGNATVSNSGSVSISGIISESGGAYSLTKADAGLLILYGANTFTGGVTIKAGILSPNTSVSALGTGVVTIGDTTGSNDTTLEGLNNLTYANLITVASGNSGIAKITCGTGGSPTFSGSITLNKGLTVATDGSNTVLSGAISGSGDITIGSTGTGTVTISNTAGGGINNSGTITNSGTSTGTTTISGVIGSAVTGIIQNSATSPLTLSNASNTFTGPITNSAGTLNITQNNTFSTITLAGDTTTNITAGKTITLTSLVSTGTSGHLAIWKSATASAHTLTTALAQISTDYLDLRYSQPTQTATWYAGTHSSDDGHDGNWVFTAPNSAPVIGTGPSDGSSASATPTNAGQNTAFSATATDAEGNNYYLAVCKTNAITAHNSDAPTCATSQTLCVSASTASASSATCNYRTSASDAESTPWYAFVCDNNAASACSTPGNQGNLTDPTGSPFAVNHAPSFTATAVGTNPIAVGASQTFSATASDADTDGSADTVTYYACKSNDFTGTACGTAGEWCHSTASASNPSCAHTILSTDGSGSKNYFGYIIDSHNFPATSNPRSGTFVISAGGGNVGPSGLNFSGMLKFLGNLLFK